MYLCIFIIFTDNSIFLFDQKCSIILKHLKHNKSNNWISTGSTFLMHSANLNFQCLYLRNYRSRKSIRPTKM